MTQLIPRKQVLLVDDEERILTTSKLCLQGSGIDDVHTISDSSQVMDHLARGEVAVIVLDLHMPYPSGVELLPKIVHDFPHIPVVIVTADDEIETVVDCIKMGACDYLVKPVDSRRLAACVSKALELASLSSELSDLTNRLLTDRLDHPEAFDEIVTGNKNMRAIFHYAEIVALTRQPVLITGETGAGKELVARAIHQLSGVTGEYVPLNAAGLDDIMFSDTLFGHKKGAFTGAEQNREGLVARAAGGTLFLDEIGDLKEMSQLKLLRLLQEHEYYPVGSDFAKKSTTRIILATNRNLLQLMEEGGFRRDLYYRLSGHRIHLPPLRERMDDIPLLLEHFLDKAAVRLNKKKPTPPPELAVLLSLYNFPGNVRELEALVMDAVVRHSSGILSMETFRAVVGEEGLLCRTPGAPESQDTDPLSLIFGHFPTVDEIEQYMIGEAMRLAGGSLGEAARLLGIGRQTLNKRLKGE